MKITLLAVGQTDLTYLKEGIAEYRKRLEHYVSFELKTIAPAKKTGNLPEEVQKKKEGDLILKYISRSKSVVLLDENGMLFTSEKFSGFIQKKMASGLKELVFVIGGPYGFSQEVYEKVMDKISFSKMTFPHHLIRLIFLEQLYRAFTIIKGEPYHHD